MSERVKLSRVESEFEKLDYPVTRDDAASEFIDVTVTFADGEANLGELVSEMGSDAFHGPDELYAELQNVLPVEAVGEPGQSDGDA
ncbi:hypothetical protein SAMN04488065_0182 [Haloplanus vescus]|uniref:DUF2795 domain-containing protein n=1 Tax=Haloplanus vescus TaxID=555874 RepID=A0A1H3VQL4_9EURY|nr:hypothetical protein [Haloplanus vescus]SDZ77076.1 hypothetical protein SAMN04488065_0182 [Haloplanus vescus]